MMLRFILNLAIIAFDFEQGSARCRLPRSILLNLSLRPGDAVVVRLDGSIHPFLCSAAEMRQPHEEGSVVTQVDGCIELPITALKGPPADPGSSDSADPAIFSIARGWVAPLEMVSGGFQSLSIRCADQNLDPSPHMRVQISRALVGHTICTGAPPLTQAMPSLLCRLCVCHATYV
jgi:hypothetical protein